MTPHVQHQRALALPVCQQRLVKRRQMSRAMPHINHRAAHGMDKPSEWRLWHQVSFSVSRLALHATLDPIVTRWTDPCIDVHQGRCSPSRLYCTRSAVPPDTGAT